MRLALLVLAALSCVAASHTPALSLSAIYVDNYPRVDSRGEFWDALSGSGPDLFVVVRVDGDARFRSGVFEDLPARHGPLEIHVEPAVRVNPGQNVAIYLYDEDLLEGEYVASVGVRGDISLIGLGRAGIEGDRGSRWRLIVSPF